MINLYFFLLVLKQVNAVVVKPISMIHMKILCIPDVLENLNVRVFNLMPTANDTRHIQWHGTRKCKCGLDASVCNNKQRWNEDKCRCEFK